MSPAFDIEFEVYCTCGEGLCRNTKTGSTKYRGIPFIEVDPCEKCLEKAKTEGRQEAENER